VFERQKIGWRREHAMRVLSLLQAIIMVAGAMEMTKRATRCDPHGAQDVMRPAKLWPPSVVPLFGLEW
jgi:hypothetical protein